MKKEEFKDFMDNISNYLSNNPILQGPGGLLSNIIKKEINFLVILTIIYLLALVVKQRSRSIYKYIVTLTVAVIAIYTFAVSTMFDESVKNGTATPDVLRGLPPVCIYIVIRLFHLIPPLQLIYYGLPVILVAYSIYYHNLLRSPSPSKSKTQKSQKSQKPQKSPRSSKTSLKPPKEKSSKDGKKHSHTHSHSHSKESKKSFKSFIRKGFSLLIDFTHSFILIYAYAVLVLLIFINNNYDFTINSINVGTTFYGKFLRLLDMPFLNHIKP